MAIASIDRDRLGRIAALADTAGAEDVAREARAFAERLESEQLFVTCLGLCTRSKSTLMIALVGEIVLPVCVVPVTSAVTIVRYGAAPKAVVRYADGRSESIDPADLDEYVAEARNPGNLKGVAVGDVFLAGHILADGLCLVDTPGVGSVSIAGSEICASAWPRAVSVWKGIKPVLTFEKVNCA